MNIEIQKLAKRIVEYSINVQPKEKVLIMYFSNKCKNLIKELIKNINNSGGVPFYKLVDKELDALLLNQNNDGVIDLLVSQLEYEVNKFDSIIYVRYTENEYETKSVDSIYKVKLSLKSRPFNDIRVNQRKWVLFNYPSVIDAYKAHMSFDEFYNYAFSVMNVDYSKMREKLEPLKQLMEKTDKVRMVGPGTDISFSIKGMPAIPCCGTANIPDGEIYTAPIKDSVNGKITYNTASPYNGNVFNNVSLTFKNGKIIEANCDEEVSELNKIFDTDEGARYIGEFAIGVNPKIMEPIGDILYDEKIYGSIHFTPGKAYDDCYNGNCSSIHWDLVWIQRSEYGGGEIYFDDILIRKDGLFVLDELKELNDL